MRLTFRGTSMGEWVLSLRRAVDFACLSVVRDAARARGRTVSLDEEHPEGGGRRHEAQVAAVLAGEAERDEEREAAADALRAGLALLDHRRRTVLERTLDGATAEELAAELGTSVDNVYALRSRALKQLAKLGDRWHA
jgi:DNA-directed RNA polymerase specialized sigma24 family protein